MSESPRSAGDDEPSLLVDPGQMEPDILRAALARFDPAAGDAASVSIVRAPGRVNLIGEHTDYNEGLVLPAAIGLEIRIALVPSDGRRVELGLVAGSARAELSLDEIPPSSGQWIDYPAGVAWALEQAGVAIGGFRGVLASTLPIASGLSSSA